MSLQFRNKRVHVLKFTLALCLGVSAKAQTFSVVSTFTGLSGAYPYGALTIDSAGTIFGTTYYGGSTSNGTVFADLYGAEPVLHNFTGSDGSVPKGRVIADQNGTLYGTTEEGGSFGAGTVFALNRSGVLTTLYSFAGGTTDGADPFGGLVLDSAGNLYGTTIAGGSSNMGTVWSLSPSGKETIVHEFSGPDGDGPGYGSLLQDAAGNMYGTTNSGGSSNAGVVYKISMKGSFSVLYNFTGGKDGGDPDGTLVQDSRGNLYGTTSGAGQYGGGTIWRLSSSGTLTLLHEFTGTLTDGSTPFAGLIPDKQGDLYGVTYYAGSNGQGTIFKLKGTVFTLLHSFNCPTDGCYPVGAPVLDKSGNLYGTGNVGGAYNYGTVWKITF